MSTTTLPDTRRVNRPPSEPYLEALTHPPEPPRRADAPFDMAWDLRGVCRPRGQRAPRRVVVVTASLRPRD